MNVAKALSNENGAALKVSIFLWHGKKNKTREALTQVSILDVSKFLNNKEDYCRSCGETAHCEQH